MKNILSQAEEKGIAAGAGVDAALLTEATEKALAERSAELAGRVAGVCARRRTMRRRWRRLLRCGRRWMRSSMRVMVMAPDAAVRANRLALLERCWGISRGLRISRRLWSRASG